MKVASIVGARPQFVKLAPVSGELRKYHTEVVIHTGQHYDYLMSQLFFEELNIPPPDYNLGVGSATHGKQTGEMLIRIEEVLLRKKPDWVLVFGDANTTLAGALAAVKLGIPVAHVESGMRSYNRSMPEEINRICADHVSDLLFCATPASVENLAKEGITEGVHFVGDVMYDTLLVNLDRAESRSEILETFGVKPASYLLVTVHRPVNTDNVKNLTAIMSAFAALDEEVVFPAHPRTVRALELAHIRPGPNVRLIDPVGYLDMLVLERNARMILTDSGGVQKEAYLLAVPCVTLREETALVETVEVGWNRLVGSDTASIISAAKDFSPTGDRPPIFGHGDAAKHIVAILTAQQQDKADG